MQNTITENTTKKTENTITIKSINELLEYSFFIPSYQRGYRWTEQQVTQLLEDVHEFKPKEINNGEKTWYCLQPLIVKKKNGVWEVIDGQQRLTTIYLILHYLNQGYVESRRKKLFRLSYETREKSAEFLKKLNENRTDDSNVDYFFISTAYQTIAKWFDDNGQTFDINSFESKLFFHVKVIWYEVPESQDSIDIFTRINIGKIPLTNAELIKALFLNSSNFPNADPEKLRLKQLEIASEWDRIEYALQDDAFWYFINQSKNDLATRIEFIFNLMAEIDGQNINTNDPYSTFYFFSDKFKKDNPEEAIHQTWKEVKKYFQTLEEWFNDRELYHKIGFLITARVKIKDIIKNQENKSKSEFKNWIDEQIKQSLNLKEEDLDNIYYKNNSKIKEILLLHNVLTTLKSENESFRFPFEKYKKDEWDIEHIHAIASEVYVKKEEQVEWLKNNFVQTENHKDEELNKQIKEIIESQKTIEDQEFKKITEYVLGEGDHSLRNLCLLDRSTNRSYKNASFKNKRSIIIDIDKHGAFIPICTRNVFLKYYSQQAQDLELWNDNDRENYLENIKSVIKEYLKP
ncbi:MAG: hypothetical protein KatS3mg035_0241 [Bacteroidia bacterium]|nr:MAG: hypothetical protein KatS3mg035_0241 [Bacteroidia bacterium]